MFTPYNIQLPISNDVIEVFQSIIGQLSDGIWEGSRAKEKFWQNVRVDEGPEGMCIFSCNGDCLMGLKLHPTKLNGKVVGQKYGSFLKAIMQKVYEYDADKVEYPTFRKWFNITNEDEIDGYIGYRKTWTVGEVKNIYVQLTRK